MRYNLKNEPVQENRRSGHLTNEKYIKIMYNNATC